MARRGWKQKEDDKAKRGEVLLKHGNPKPCPCCGHLTPEYFTQAGVVYGRVSGRVPWWREQVKCHCGVQTAEQSTPGRALKIWNREYDPIDDVDATSAARRVSILEYHIDECAGGLDELVAMPCASLRERLAQIIRCAKLARDKT